MAPGRDFVRLGLLFDLVDRPPHGLAKVRQVANVVVSGSSNYVLVDHVLDGFEDRP
jgi:hypothetical protein